MKPETFQGNLNRTLLAMKEQTGKEPGGPTGLCHTVVLGTFTGTHLTFLDYEYIGQVRQEASAGLLKYDVQVGGHPLRAIPALLRQREIGMEGLFLRGDLKNDNEAHIIGVIPLGAENNPSYQIVDSLLPGATLTCTTIDQVTAFADERFDSKTLEIAVVPDANEKSGRKPSRKFAPDMVTIAEGIVIQADAKAFGSLPV